METRLVEQRLKKTQARVGILLGEVMKFRRSNLTPRDFFPGLGAIMTVPHIGETINHGDEKAFEKLENSLAEQLPSIIDQIRRDREETLLELLPPGYTSPDPLKLATTWFTNGIACEAGRAEDALNEMWGFVGKGELDWGSASEIIQWSSVVPEIEFEKNVMAVVTKVIEDLGVGDPEKMTAEELDKVPCRIVIFSKVPQEQFLNMEVGSWRHLVRAFSFRTLGTFRALFRGNRYKRSHIRNIKSPAGGSLKTTNSQKSRPQVSLPPRTPCGIACTVGRRGRIAGLLDPLERRIICWMCEF